MSEVYTAERLLVWDQPKGMRRYFSLHAGQHEIGEMFWPRWLSDEAVATVRGRSWRMRRLGFFRRNAEAVPVDGGPVARFEQRMRGDGPITIGEDRYDWQLRSVWRSEYALIDPNGMEVLHVRFRPGIFRQSAELRVPPWATEHRHLALLVAFVFYLASMRQQDTAAAAAAS